MSTSRFPFTVKLFRAGFYTDCEVRLALIAKIKDTEGTVNRTSTFNRLEGMGSRTPAEGFALSRKGHILGITGKGVDADEAQWLIYGQRFRDVAGGQLLVQVFISK